MTFKPDIYSNWNLQSNLKFYKRMEIYVDRISETINIDSVTKIIIIQESHNTENIFKFVQENKVMYDYVFTYYDEILKTNEKAVKFLCIKTWIKDYIFPQKVFGVSTIVGGKIFSGLLGHPLRHELWNKRNEILIPKQFYLSSHYKYDDGDYVNDLVLGDKKEPLFDTMFHITIENTSINNVFTEKLIDCFQTKTIPIYWGAPNIGEYFNLDGMFLVKNIDNIINISNNLTPKIYESKLNAIEDNYQRSMNYVSQTQILDRTLSELLK